MDERLTKRLLSILLACAVAFFAMALTAYAAEDPADAQPAVSASGVLQKPEASELQPLAVATMDDSAKAKRTILLYDCGSDLETDAGMATYNLLQILASHFSANGDIRFIVMTGGSHVWQLDDDKDYNNDNGYLVFPEGVNVPEGAVVAPDPDEPYSFIATSNEKGRISGVYNQLWEAKGADDPIYGGEGHGKLVLLDGDGITGTDGNAVMSGDELMSDPKTLKAFINYGVDNFPAERYDLILWDHGGGPQGGFGVDEHYEWDPNYSKSSIMSFSGIVDALSHNKAVDSDGDGVLDGRFDFVDFDACLMSSVELALVMADYTDYYIASAETEPGYGQYYGPCAERDGKQYKGWLDELGNPANDAKYDAPDGTFELGKVIVDDFYNFYEKEEGDGHSQDGTLAVFDTQKMVDSGTGFVDALSALCKQLTLEAQDPDLGKGVRFYDELKSFYGSIEYGGDCKLFDLGDAAAFLGVVNCEVSPKNLEDGEFVNYNDYVGISKTITELLQRQYTDPENAFMYARGTSGIETAGNYYRARDGQVLFGSLGTSGLSIFFPGFGFGQSAKDYFSAMDPVIDSMPAGDRRAQFLRDYEETVAYYDLLLYCGRCVSLIINNPEDTIEIMDKSEVDYDMVMAFMKDEWTGTWDSSAEPDLEKIQADESAMDEWFRQIIAQQVEDAVETDAVTVTPAGDEEGAACTVTISEAKKRVVKSVERNVTAELPELEKYLATLDASTQKSIRNFADLSLGSQKGTLAGMPEGASVEEMIEWYNESGGTWEVDALQQKWYAINDADGAIHVASIYRIDEDGYYVPALYGASSDGPDKNRLVMLEFSPYATDDGRHGLTSIYYMNPDTGPVQIMLQDLTREITVTPILYIRPMMGDNYYAPISESSFAISKDNAGSVSLDYMDIGSIGDIGDTNGDGKALNSTVTITDLYSYQIEVSDRIHIKNARIRPARYTGEELVPKVMYYDEILREGVDYIWQQDSVYDPGVGQFVVPDLIEPGDHEINLFGKGRFEGLRYEAVFSIVKDEEGAQALVQRAEAELATVQAKMQSAEESGSQRAIAKVEGWLANAQCALADARALQAALGTPRNGIPVVYVYVDESDEAIAQATAADPKHRYGTLAEVNASEDHSVRCVGSVEVQVPEGYASAYGTSTVPSGKLELSYMRGRGNATWMEDKKPYRLEFKSEQDFFGMGGSTTYALIANASDESLLRNRVAYWLGSEIGLSYPLWQVPVDVVMVTKRGGEEVGTYIGSYCLSEDPRVEPARVDIDKLGKGDVDETAITGGYLLAVYNSSQDADLPASTVFTTPSGVELTNHTPEFGEDLSEGRNAQRAYIRAYVNSLDDLIMAEGSIDESRHNQIADLLDLRSTADYWWLQEFTRNGDAYRTGSTYLYKPRDGKLAWGPVWDFDRWGWASGTGFNGSKMAWTDNLRDADPLFVALLKERWNAADGMNAKLVEITKQGGILDQYRDEIAQSWQVDQALWSPGSAASLDDKVESLRQWIEARRAWVNEHLDEIDRVFFTVTYEVDGETMQTEKVRSATLLKDAPDAPAKEGYRFLGWAEKETGADLLNYRVEDNTTFVAQYVSESMQPEQVCFLFAEDWVDLGASGGQAYTRNRLATLPFGSYPGEVTWSTSDPGSSDAYEIEGKAAVYAWNPGDYVITATLENGVSGSYVLHAYRSSEVGEPSPVQSVRLPSELTLRVGQDAQIVATLLPEDTILDTSNISFSYTSADADVVAVADSAFGIVTGVFPGTATVTLAVSGADGASGPLTATCEVTVVGTPRSITYRLAGGSYDGNTEDVVESHDDGEIIIIKDAPVRDGYRFLYWEGSRYYPGDEYTVAGDHTFTAVWEPIAAPSGAEKSAAPATKKSAAAKTGDPVQLAVITLAATAAIAGAVAIAIALRRRRDGR